MNLNFSASLKNLTAWGIDLGTTNKEPRAKSAGNRKFDSHRPLQKLPGGFLRPVSSSRLSSPTRGCGIQWLGRRHCPSR